MKQKATRQYLKRLYGGHIIYVPYCELQNLLQFESPAYYCTRSEGWACDCYIVGDYLIATGYAPFGYIKPSYKTLKKYNDAAAKVYKKYKKYETKQKHLYYLLNNFVENCRR